MPKPFTHILFEYPDQKAHSLYRAKDGLNLAYQQDIGVIFGNDPNPAKLEHRKFLDTAFALAYLRFLADADQNGIPLDKDVDVAWGAMRKRVDITLANASIEERRPPVIVAPSLELGNKFSKTN